MRPGIEFRNRLKSAHIQKTIGFKYRYFYKTSTGLKTAIDFGKRRPELPLLERVAHSMFAGWSDQE